MPPFILIPQTSYVEHKYGLGTAKQMVILYLGSDFWYGLVWR